MVHTHAAFGHDLFQIAVREGIADVEELGEAEHVFRTMYAVEINCPARVSA